jgi:hypothetical protein
MPKIENKSTNGPELRLIRNFQSGGVFRCESAVYWRLLLVVHCAMSSCFELFTNERRLLAVSLVK